MLVKKLRDEYSVTTSILPSEPNLLPGADAERSMESSGRSSGAREWFS